MNRSLLLSLATLAASAALLPACSAEPKNADAKTSLATGVDTAMENFKTADPSIQTALDSAAGYAIFPELGKGGLGIGGAYGHGEVYEGGKMVGYCDLTEGTIGLQAGGERFSELIIFKDQDTLNKFKNGIHTFAANMSAVAVKPGAAKAADYKEGTAVFVRADSGLMAEAAVGAQKFRFRPL